MDVNLGFRVRAAPKKTPADECCECERVLEREPSSHGSHIYFIILHLNFLNPNFICIRFLNLK